VSAQSRLRRTWPRCAARPLGSVDFEPTDDQLREVSRRDPHLLALAMMWSWHDTEVREQLCAALTALA